jgi:hypothetical protein
LFGGECTECNEEGVVYGPGIRHSTAKYR